MKDAIVIARKRAEDAVADMPEGPLKIAAFQTILSSLLTAGPPSKPAEKAEMSAPKKTKAAGGTTGRIQELASEGFFNEQRSLGDVQQALAARGFHYPQENLGTPMMRLVRNKFLRRVQINAGGKRIWGYSNY